MSDNATGLLVFAAFLGLVIALAVGFVSCERIQNETQRACLAAGNKPTECAVLGRGRQ